MPTYQYACRTCDHRFDAVQSFTDEPMTVCPECGGPLRKVFSAVGVVFKGSGFYRNDSRSKVTAGAGSAGGGESNGERRPAEATSADGKSSEAPSSKGSDEKSSGPKPADKPADKPAAASTAIKPTASSTSRRPPAAKSA